MAAGAFAQGKRGADWDRDAVKAGETRETHGEQFCLYAEAKRIGGNVKLRSRSRLGNRCSILR